MSKSPENIHTTFDQLLQRSDKEQLLKQHSLCVWFTGLSGSGKTTIAEMYLAHEIKQRKGKGMFLVPLKALAQEKIDQWSSPNHFFSEFKIFNCYL